MIKEAIDRILELSIPSLHILNGREYSDRRLSPIKKPDEMLAEAVIFRSLKGFCQYIPENLDSGSEFVQVAGPHEVLFLGKLDGLNQRQTWAKAEYNSKAFAFGAWMALDEFIVSLDTMFVSSPKIEDLKNLLGHIANENIKTHTDDGFSQSIQVKTGITTKAEVKIENPIMLRTYRTFREIEQPEVPCLLRLKAKDGNVSCALWSADGGMWELEAIKAIGEYLRKELPETIKVLA
jgi:hypothetical protein